MKIVFSPLVAGMSGRAADVVAAAWKGVSYVRKFVVPHNPKSAAQVTQRGYFARMAIWFRSLPSDLVAYLDSLAVGQGKSGFNLMAGLDLKHLAAAEDPEVVPANPDCNALFSVADATSVAEKEIDLTWVAGVAISTHYVHMFTCPVEPDETGLEEPDGWTEYDTPTLVSAAGVTGITVLNSGKDYYVACILADTNDLATATVMSGGVGVTATSGSP